MIQESSREEPSMQRIQLVESDHSTTIIRADTLFGKG